MDIPLEKVNCNFCGRDETALFLSENGFHLNRCTGCGLLYVNPRPAPSGEMPAYSGEYGAYVEAYIRNRANYLREASNRLAEIEPWGKKGKLLDIGCAAGFFLDSARQRGWDVYGIEPNDKLAHYGQNVLKLNVAVCDVLAHPYEENMFDVVTAYNVVGHVRNPARFFQEIHRLLKPGGIFVMHTGNNAELSSKEEGEILRENWGTPDHLYHFSQGILEEYLKRGGFAIEKSERRHLISLLFSKDNLRTFKGSALKTALKRTLLVVPPLRIAAAGLFVFYFVKIKKNKLCKLALVARKNAVC
jgi:SAM-dependent methyltransferase